MFLSLCFFTVPCLVELRDDSEGGIGNIADVLIKQGLVTATEQVCLYRNLNTFLTR